MAELTTSEAVRIYGIHLATVFRLILAGKVKARKDRNGRWLIRSESLDCWNRQRGHKATSREERVARETRAGAA
jgi:predicted site-specific integrase-resolvase